MSALNRILFIDQKPAKDSIGTLLQRRWPTFELLDVMNLDMIRAALGQAELWDLILCDAASFESFGVAELLRGVREHLNASVVLLQRGEPRVDIAQVYRLGVADVVDWADEEHLLAVCERELANALMRKEIRELRCSATQGHLGPNQALVVATIQDMSPGARQRQVEGHAPHHATVDARGGEVRDGAVDQRTYIRELIDAGGLTLEYQPIISLRANEEHRRMFETLVRLKDRTGRLLAPSEFLPVVSAAGWMNKVDLWILRRALATLKEMQQAGSEEIILFINVAAETLRSEKTAKAMAAFVSASGVAPGSVVIELRQAVFQDSVETLQTFARVLRERGHGILVEDLAVDDLDFLTRQTDLISHIKLGRDITQGLVERRISQESVNTLVKCAQEEGMRVIALAVDNAELLPMLFAAGVDAIQGHFVSMPYQTLMYPSIQRVESSSTPAWQDARGSS
ncbi:diguanylate phosphodiesterase [Thiocapsa imhoffii]|uniref:Diguanylate phosphodiesterase n=1 Tax=Thiocapsa imhoffii TaxID=382777 RepID=A0A9X0WKI4_9GAMM|nr:EAL domain-containing protein [Thiocapsa imhoffii]MBK1646253.1 diguanylate phosphodiesterase [Thiocapsa imhoffii]